MKASQLLSDLQHATALASIRGAHLKHVGIMPAHEGKGRLATAPVDPTSQDMNTTLGYALSSAFSYWPDCSDWWICTSDKISYSDQIPGDLVLMHAPEQCGVFTSN
jgi:hypothetical protein